MVDVAALGTLGVLTPNGGVRVVPGHASWFVRIMAFYPNGPGC